jgi:signal peptidase I
MDEPTTDEPVKKPGALATLRTLATFALLAWALRSLVIAPFSIPSGSMLPTMYIGDYLFVHKWPYGYSRFSFPLQIPSFEGRLFESLPERGDVVVFRPPGQEGTDWVKRVIGLPGDTIAVEGGTVILNGRPLQRESENMAPIAVSANSPCRVVPGAVAMVRPAAGGGRDCLYPAYRETLPNGRSYLTIDQVDVPRSDDFPQVRVPAKHLFLMGDNRDDSLDSRYSAFEGGIGLVPVDHVVGRASARFWSTDGSAEWIKPWTWATALRGSRIGGSNAP